MKSPLERYSKRIKRFLFFIPMIFLVSGCSWQEYFLIINESPNDITIEYSIPNPNSGLGIFNITPGVYKLNSSGNIDWDKPLAFADKDTTLSTVKLILPPKSFVVIGNLMNDTYIQHNQKFINGVVFNLKQIRINNNQNSIEITPENFDNFFKKMSGNIEYRIK